MKEEKETKQAYLIKLESIEKEHKEYRHLHPKKDKGLIIGIKEQTNTDYFGVMSNYGEKNGIVIEVKINSPDGETFTEWMNLTESAKLFEKSNIFAFQQKYGKFPQIGVEVDVKIDTNGFYKIDY